MNIEMLNEAMTRWNAGVVFDGLQTDLSVGIINQEEYNQEIEKFLQTVSDNDDRKVLTTLF